MLGQIVKKNGNLNKLLESIPYKQISVFGCGSNERLAIIDSLDSFILYLVDSEDTAINVNNKLLSLGKSSRIFSPDFNYSISTIYNYSKINRLLNEILYEEVNCLVVPVSKLIYKISNIDNFKKHISLSLNQTISRKDLINELISMGYTHSDNVEHIGEYRVMGDIMDIYPICSDNPIRISFFDDEIDDIYSYSGNYSKIENLDEIDIHNNNFLGNIDYDRVRKEISKSKSGIKDNEDNYNLQSIENNIELNVINPFLHIFADVGGSIFDYLPKDTTIVIDDAKLLYDTLESAVKDKKEHILEDLHGFNLLESHKHTYIEFGAVLERIKSYGSAVAFQMLTNNNRFFNPQMVFNLKSIPVGNYVGKSAVLINDISAYIATRNTVLVFVKNKDNLDYYRKLLDGARISYVETSSARNIIQNTVNIVPTNYLLSFGFRDETFVVIGSDSLFGDKQYTTNKKLKAQKVVDFVPEVNDYVVHETHGVGRYIGIENLHVNNVQKDYLVIEYKNSDKLYLPVEYTNRISKYIGGDDLPKLNKLGGVEFANIKSKVKSSLKELAFSLVELYKARENSKGYVYSKDEELERVFEESFPYTETPDQLKAIESVMSDMEKGRVMDRLICGDVGYGKTEVAIRAIFKTVMHGKQCMFMCPTTVLSQQHYNTCLSRLQDFGIRVEVLNRFKTKSQISIILDKLSKGEIDVLCGTHRLLSKDVVFKDLGLLVLDEEQKFGVGDKEEIKNIKSNINVLTLSATPIPRTLHMSMVGIRDISIISTPPENRLNVSTTVTEYSDELLKNAILREIERGGQVLVIYNRVDNIYAISSHINDMFGGTLNIGVAHGQMSQELLENAIYNLYNGNTQVLVATTLIENGVDLPKANTLFVLDADNLGLSQLYQLKGRVGRNNIQAYAYFTYLGGKVLSSDSYKRLQAILEYSDMGSGYKIAMRDLEIRGAGNVLGPEQHGHMQKVGYALYMSLLNEAISEVKDNSKVFNNFDTVISTTLPAYMPEDYVTDSNSKTAIYSMISGVANTNDLIDVTTKLKEFGEIPLPLVNLMKVALIKNMCTKLKVAKVDISKFSASMEFGKQEEMLSDNIVEAVGVYSNYVSLNLTNLPIIDFRVDNGNNILDIIIEFLGYII